jgi:hypothetical protein
VIDEVIGDERLDLHHVRRLERLHHDADEFVWRSSAQWITRLGVVPFVRVRHVAGPFHGSTPLAPKSAARRLPPAIRTRTADHSCETLPHQGGQIVDEVLPRDLGVVDPPVAGRGGHPHQCERPRIGRLRVLPVGLELVPKDHGQLPSHLGLEVRQHRLAVLAVGEHPLGQEPVHLRLLLQEAEVRVDGRDHQLPGVRVAHQRRTQPVDQPLHVAFGQGLVQPFLVPEEPVHDGLGGPGLRGDPAHRHLRPIRPDGPNGRVQDLLSLGRPSLLDGGGAFGVRGACPAGHLSLATLI